MVRALTLIMLAACGSVPTIEPPNTVIACERAIACGAVADRAACVACVETVADRWNDEARAYFGDDMPALESIPCDGIAALARATNLTECVAERWFGP